MLRNAATYLTGSVIAQIITLIAVPVLSRLYSPDDFGVFGVFTALLSITAVAACLRYELAIPLPKSKRRAVSVLLAGLSSLLATTLIATVVVAMGRDYIAGWFGMPGLSELLWLLPLSILGYGVYQLLNYWATRNGQFSMLASSGVLRAISVSGTQIGGASVFSSGLGLVAGQLVGQWVANVALLFQISSANRKWLGGKISLRRVQAVARRYRSFPIHGAPQAMLNSLSQSLPAIMLGWFFAPAMVGFFVMAHRVVWAPLSLVANALRQAMLPHFATELNSGKALAPLLWKFVAGLAVLGLPVLLVLMLWGQELFAFVLGERWLESGRYAEWLVLWLWAGLINPPAVVVLTVLEKQKLQALYEMVLLIARVLALASGLWTESAIVTVALFSIVGFIFNLTLVWMAHWCATRARLRKVGYTG